MLRRIRAVVDVLVRRDRFERAMADEIQQHLAAYVDDLVRGGMPRSDAWRQARVEFGGIERVKDECREARGAHAVDQLRQDLRFALRQLAHHPGFAMAAVLSIALGIGANTAIFSVTDAVLFRTAPVRNPEQLYFLAHGVGDTPSLSSNYPLLQRYRDHVDAFTGVTGYMVGQFKVTTEAGSELVDGQYVSGNYHAVVGVPMLLGRGFESEPDQPGEHSHIAIISEPYWASRFGRDANVIGKTLTVQGQPVTVVGVTGDGFHGLKPGTHFDITLPLSMRAIETPELLTAKDRWIGLRIVARLRPGVSATAALASADGVFRRYMAEPEQAGVWRGGTIVDAFREARLVPAGKGTHELRQQYERPLRVLMAIVGIVLLIACANVANLMFVRASARAKETAIRLGLGASASRLVRQFLTESLLLAIAGGVIGLLISVWATSAIVSLFRAWHDPVLLDIGPNMRVLGFTTGLSVLTGLIFGLAPALNATRLELTPALNEHTVTSPGRHGRLSAGRALAAFQMALCMVVIVGTVLLVRTLLNLKSVDAGFQTRNVSLFYVDTRGTDRHVMEWEADLLQRLQALPGVRAASWSTASPLGTDLEERGIEIPGLPPAAEVRTAIVNRVTPDYFSALSVNILRGRGFTNDDSAAAPKVALVTETMARAYFGANDPIGRTLTFASRPEAPATIVGIARDVRHQTLRTPPARMLYLPLAQADEPPPMLTGALETTHSAPAIEAALRAAVRDTSPDLVISYFRTIEQQVDATLLRERALAVLSVAFGALSLVLACVGLYGVMSYSVARRTREMGIRLAVGARPGTLLWGIAWETVVVSSVGIVLGLAAALALTHALSSFLFGLSPRDPVTLAAAVAILLVTTAVAAYLPARRAAHVSPTIALRMD